MGISSQRSSYLFIGIGLGSLVTRIGGGKLCEYMKPVYVNQRAALCGGVSTLLLSMNSRYTVLVVIALMYGLADGAFLTTCTTIPLSCVPPEKRSVALGFTNMMSAVTLAIGPMITGKQAYCAESNYTIYF
jgi:MFS family permease